MPLIVVSPGQATDGLRVNDPVSLVDLCPTLLDCLVEKSLPGMSGRSLRPALRGENLPPEDCYAETDEPYQTARWSPMRALIPSEFKYVPSAQPELYYLSQDPGEANIIAHEESGPVQTIEQRLSRWELSIQQSFARRILLIDCERSALNSLVYAAHGQSGSKTLQTTLAEARTDQKPCSNRPEAESHTILDNFSGSKKTKQKIQHPPGTMSGESGMTAADLTEKNVERVHVLQSTSSLMKALSDWKQRTVLFLFNDITVRCGLRGSSG